MSWGDGCWRKRSFLDSKSPIWDASSIWLDIMTRSNAGAVNRALSLTEGRYSKSDGNEALRMPAYAPLSAVFSLMILPHSRRSTWVSDSSRSLKNDDVASKIICSKSAPAYSSYLEAHRSKADMANSVFDLYLAYAVKPRFIFILCCRFQDAGRESVAALEPRNRFRI